MTYIPKKLLKQLRSVELFADLSHDDLRAVAELFKGEHVSAGSIVYHQGQVGECAYLIESGTLGMYYIDPDGKREEVRTLQAGDFLGESSLLLGDTRSATVEAAQESSLLCLEKSDFDKLLQDRPSVVRSLWIQPDVVKRRRVPRFRWQDPDEVVVRSMHKHNAILFRNLALPTVIFLVIVAGIGAWVIRSQSMVALVLGAVLALIPLAFGIYLTVDHFNDSYVITNKRVLHEERTPLVREARAEAPLRTVQDIHQRRQGIWAQIYNFGDLIIETAGKRGQVIFRSIPDPAAVQEEIFEQVRRVRAGARAQEREAIRSALEQRLGRQEPDEQQPPVDQPESNPSVSNSLRAGMLFRVFRYFLPSLRYESGDTVTWRKHWFALLRPISVPSLLVMVTAAATIYLLATIPAKWPQIVLGYGGVMMILLPWWLWRFDNWQNDIYQVTNTRIIDVECLPFSLREDRREASLGVIQNIELEVPGILGRIFNYGSVTIETAGVGPFTFEMVKDPGSVQTEIFRRMDAFQRMQRQQSADQRRSELMDWFTVYDDLQGSDSPANAAQSDYQEGTEF